MPVAATAARSDGALASEPETKINDTDPSKNTNNGASGPEGGAEEEIVIDGDYSSAEDDALGELAASGCLFVCLLVGWLVGWLTGWLIGWLVGWFCLFVWLVWKETSLVWGCQLVGVGRGGGRG